jgi:hypothetical protein
MKDSFGGAQADIDARQERRGPAMVSGREQGADAPGLSMGVHRERVQACMFSGLPASGAPCGVK